MQLSRKQISIGNNKILKAIEILTELLTTHNDEVKENDSYDLPNYLLSLSFKNIICQFPSFKKLCTYLSTLTDGPGRAEKIQNFLGKILYANDEDKLIDWYSFDLLYKVKKSETNIFKQNDKELRGKLVDDFIAEISSHLMQKFGTLLL